MESADTDGHGERYALRITTRTTAPRQGAELTRPTRDSPSTSPKRHGAAEVGAIFNGARQLRATALTLALVVWGVAVLAGFGRLIDYAARPGDPGAPTAAWPADEALAELAPVDASFPALLMFVHPRCPCSRASVRELERLLADTGSRLTATILIFTPTELPAAWSDTDLRNLAQAIPGARVKNDPDGRLARRFGVSVSGHVLVYGTNRRLAFSGGITSARGHEGNNSGREAVAAIAFAHVPERSVTPVFGCPIHSSPGACAPGQTESPSHVCRPR